MLKYYIEIAGLPLLISGLIALLPYYSRIFIAIYLTSNRFLTTFVKGLLETKREGKSYWQYRKVRILIERRYL